MSDGQAIPAAFRPPGYTEVAQAGTQLAAARVLLNRDMILKAAALKTEEVPVPEWGGSVLVRELRGRERDEFEASLTVQRGTELVSDSANMRAKLAARTIVGEDGEPLFTQQDVAALGELSAAALERVIVVASRLSGLGPAAVEGAAKNSAAAP